MYQISCCILCIVYVQDLTKRQMPSNIANTMDKNETIVAIVVFMTAKMHNSDAQLEYFSILQWTHTSTFADILGLPT